MKRKNIFAATAVCALLVGVLAIPASAHHGGGHHARRAAATTLYPACTVDDCTLGYSHDHDGVTYCGHSYNDGHTWCTDNAGYGRGGCHRR